MNKVFSELKDGDKFKVNNVIYEKIPPIKISCCKSLNAREVDSHEKKSFFAAGAIVEVLNNG